MLSRAKTPVLLSFGLRIRAQLQKGVIETLARMSGRVMTSRSSLKWDKVTFSLFFSTYILRTTYVCLHACKLLTQQDSNDLFFFFFFFLFFVFVCLFFLWMTHFEATSCL